MGGGNQRHLTKMKKSTAWLTCEACGKTKRQTTNLKKRKKKKYLLILNEEKRRGVFVHKVKDKGDNYVGELCHPNSLKQYWMHGSKRVQ